MKSLTLFAAAAVALAPAAAFAVPLPAATYVMKAGASDMFEIESSKLVQDSKDPQIQQFAQQMITDHTKSTGDVMTAAKADGLNPPPPALTPKQKGMIDSLKHTTGAKRDLLYTKQQVLAHKETLAFQQEYARSGDKPNLKTTAGQIVPVVQNHLSMVEGMTPAAAKNQ
ncbi:MAG: DUF4142 domain-containing protein [Sphingomonadaceae bacterium]|nr:DUF4142 domain-containing protein [Sphingomonadaceae bacterium]